MAKISTYPKDINISLSDKLLGTDAESSLFTKNFEIGDFVTFLRTQDIGSQGPIGPQGIQGPSGSPGAVGPAGLTWRGSWISGTSYVANDAVSYGGASWFCILATSGTTTPNLDTANWALLASQGAIGPSGAQGPTGPQGPSGGSLPYKSYVARITHGAGNAAPTAVVIINEIGTVTWQYDEPMNYFLSSAGLFTVDKTVVFATSPTYPLMKVGVSLNTANFVGLTTDNDGFANLMLEIRVYN